MLPCPRPPALVALAAGLALSSACDVSDPSTPDNEQEVITTVRLTFTPAAGGDDLVFQFADPENDGAPVIDDVSLPVGSYALAVAFLNELENPAEDITEEVAEESDEHQIFIYGDAVDGPASDVDGAILTHSYDDTDENDLPIGLENTIVANTAGSGTLSVMLRHLPVENDSAQKVEGLAEDFAAGTTIGGEADVDVDFPVTVTE